MEAAWRLLTDHAMDPAVFAGGSWNHDFIKFLGEQSPKLIQANHVNPKVRMRVDAYLRSKKASGFDPRTTGEIADTLFERGVTARATPQDKTSYAKSLAAKAAHWIKNMPAGISALFVWSGARGVG